MTIRNLDCMLKPGSVALIGASCRQGSVGAVLAQNLASSGFKGATYLVNPKYEHIGSLRAYPDVAGLPQAPDLAVIATPPGTVPRLVSELGERGTKAVVVLTAGFCEPGKEVLNRWHTKILQAARPHLLRVLGPSSLGLLAPGARLNASLALDLPPPGNLAFVAQSGAVLTAVLDWAASRDIGFSHCVALGDMADVDIGDMLDYLTSEVHVRAILLHMEAVTHARKFMSAARAAARVKPVIVVRAGRHAEASHDPLFPPGASAGRDAVYDAAFRRSGLLRVQSIQELFYAAETLGMARPSYGDRLIVLTNGGGIGMLAADALTDEGGKLASLSPETAAQLEAVLPPTWLCTNPVDIFDDASPDRYAQAVRILLEEKEADALLVLHSPNGVISGIEAARAVVEALAKSPLKSKPLAVLTSWLGGRSAVEARALMAKKRIPTYETPADAARGFMYMARHQRSQEMLMEIPPNIPEVFEPDTAGAREVVEAAVSEGRGWLTDSEARAVLSAYRIPVVPVFSARSPEEAAQKAAEILQPVALKIASPDIRCKSEVCGVALHLEGSDAVLETAEAMRECVRRARPKARLTGFTLQPMVYRVNAHELALGMFDDPEFGPVIFFGHGGVAADAIQDTALALAPLNMHLARELISRARIGRVLEGRGSTPPADVTSVALTLVKLSQLVCDLAQLVEIEINPLVADSRGVVAVDISMRAGASGMGGHQRLAVRPYPNELEEKLTLPDGAVMTLRPIRPEDEPGFVGLFESLSSDDIRMRFLHPMKSLPRSLAARLTQIDYDREMALVLVGERASEGHELFGSVRVSADPDNDRAEFAILLRRDMTGLGLGPMLLRRIIEYSRARGIGEIYGEILAENQPMLSLCKAFGFTARRDLDDPGVIMATLKL